MGIGDFLKYVAGEAAVIAQAPLIFFTAILVMCGIAYALARWAYSTIISHKDATIASLEARVKLRDDQLVNKLASTPPDEAKALIAALQDQVSKLQPRRLTAVQRKTIADLARVPTSGSWSLRLNWNGMASDAERYAGDFKECLGSAGWSVRGTRTIGGMHFEGLRLNVPSPGALQPPAAALKKALEQASVPFVLAQRDTKESVELYLGFRPEDV
jgi:hypothetical protein